MYLLFLLFTFENFHFIVIVKLGIFIRNLSEFQLDAFEIFDKI